MEINNEPAHWTTPVDQSGLPASKKGGVDRQLFTRVIKVASEDNLIHTSEKPKTTWWPGCTLGI